MGGRGGRANADSDLARECHSDSGWIDRRGGGLIGRRVASGHNGNGRIQFKEPLALQAKQSSAVAAAGDGRVVQTRKKKLKKRCGIQNTPLIFATFPRFIGMSIIQNVKVSS